MRFAFVLAVVLVPLLSAASPCKETRRMPDGLLTPSPGVTEVVFIAKAMGSQTCWVSDEAAITRRHAPWSTFKIPHFLIALETGAASSPTEVFVWNEARRPAESYWPMTWKKDQSLRSAFTASAAWPFQDLVSKIGGANYKTWLGRFAYGNMEVPRDRDDFWLAGPLAISPAEQVGFLSCLAKDGCGASRKSVLALEEVATQGESNGQRLFAKTGSGPLRPREFSGAFEGWYVGYIRNAQGNATAAFATYVRSENYAALRTYRESVSLHL